MANRNCYSGVIHMLLIRRLIPTWVMSWYHLVWAVGSHVLLGRPSARMVIVGVTGTKGKTTTCAMVHHVLTSAGYKTGLISAAGYKIGTTALPVVQKMTMPGRGKIQRLLRQMRRDGCTHVVVETSSEGIAQFRHRGILYDVVALTNLTPEHIEAHGSYEAYREAKAELFRYAAKQAQKDVDGVPVPRAGFVSSDVAASDRPSFMDVNMDVALVDVTQKLPVVMNVIGAFNGKNAMMASTIAHTLGLREQQIAKGLQTFSGVPGRMELVQREPFTVIIDYAHEPLSYRSALSAAADLVAPKARLIAVIGATGGGRDRQRRPELGQIAAEHADVVIVTNEDPYEEDPAQIIHDVAGGVQRVKEHRPELFEVLDRRDALSLAIATAKAGDVVITLGKGSEQVMAVAGGAHVSWSEREVLQELLEEMQ